MVNALPLRDRTPSANGVVTGPEILQYDEWREDIATQVAALGRGAMLRIGAETGLGSGRVSNVVIGRYVDTRVLARVQEWLRRRADPEQLPARAANVRPVTVQELEGEGVGS